VAAECTPAAAARPADTARGACGSTAAARS